MSPILHRSINISLVDAEEAGTEEDLVADDGFGVNCLTNEVD
eukprot:CAMPEP_0202966434 /NCGR_PEP_ID=MMETSP1396-20130829/10830_1 /ASSEMBLY_ACC=CAM_ASM_000872 /TAXON_ID= /ORGANISM="Pseudokeronopsis sp., Strain Brazil" /LENGTH=41 /DNA_ID= /DNA_START= /DNA_END= /DNA_ORIENTATION=